MQLTTSGRPSKRVSPECKDIVAKILLRDASKRISIKEIQVRRLRAIASLHCKELEDRIRPP